MHKNIRFWEIDFIRAVALCLMLVQHIFVIKNLVFWNTTTVSQEVVVVGRIGALLFLLLVGVSGYLSYVKHRKNRSALNRHFILRGMSLVGCGALVSLFSYFAMPQSPIYFGVLSFIGVTVLLLPFFIEHFWLRLLTITIAPAAGYIFTFVHPSTSNWLPLGLYPVPFYSADYWPLFPWISVVLVGVVIGESIYSKGNRQFTLMDIDTDLARIVQWVGSHTLALYLLHLPLLYSIFWMIKQLSS